MTALIDDRRQVGPSEGDAGDTGSRTRPAVVCVTPVRNEAWTLERFLSCAQEWADHIVIADQGSEDGTREIAESTPKTIVVNNDSKGYDEGERHRLILEAARTVPGPRAIIAVDADEALSADVLGSPEWERALLSPPGTVLTAEWVNYLPGAERAWIPSGELPIGFIDDDRAHSPGRFHVRRVIVRPDDVRRSIDPVKLLHFQHLDWARMKSKQRRYQCAESLANPRKRPIQFYRQYHRMDAFPPSEIHVVDPRWTKAYETRGIDVCGITPQSSYPTDEEVLEMLLEHGTNRFRRLDIWDFDWQRLAAERGLSAGDLSDPRTAIESAVHRWLAATQRRGPDRAVMRMLQRTLIPFGW